MKILVATGLYAPDIGGPATHTALLEQELPSKDLEVAVYPFGDVRRWPKIIRHVLYCAGLIRRLRGASLLYALDPVSVGLPALIAATVARKPFVLRVAGDYAWEQAAGRYGTELFLDEFIERLAEQPRPVRLLAHIERFVARRARCVVVPSQYLKSIVIRWGVAEEKITVVYNAVEVPRVTTGKDELRRELGYQGLVIASAGRLVPWKGFRALIAVIARLREQDVDASCVIAGDGPERAALETYTETKGVSAHVRFLGALPKEVLARTIAGADIFVLNTGYEGLSHQLIEVMALKVPVVTTPAGGNGELIEHERTGLLVPYDDVMALENAIERLARNPQDVVTLTEAAFAKASSFTITRTIEGVVAVFKKMKS